MMALERNRKSILLENHKNVYNLHNALVPYMFPYQVKEHKPYFLLEGLEFLIHAVQQSSQYDDRELLSRSTIPILQDYLYYVTQNSVANREFFDYELYHFILPIIELAEKLCDIVFVDTASYGNLSTKLILEQIDLVVVNLSQNPYVMSHFFRNYSSIKKKAIYLIGNFNPHSNIQVENLIRKYNIPADRIFSIPYCVSFSDALGLGEVVSFFLENNECKEGEPNYNFINAVRLAACGIDDILQKFIKEKGKS